MSEKPKIKIRNNLQINFHNHISKPNYLITINPDKYLQRPAFNSAMTIKERNEINPEMAEIVSKILLKRKREKDRKYKYYHSIQKNRKINSPKNEFDYKKDEKVINNNDNNNTLILESLDNLIRRNYKNVKYFDYINKNVNNKIKIIRKRKLDTGDGIESQSSSRYDTKNNINSKQTQNKLLNYSYRQQQFEINKMNTDYKDLDTETNIDIKLNKSLNIGKNNNFFNNRQNNYMMKLNKIELDEDAIDKDENIMEIKCDYSYNESISPRNIIDKEYNKSEKKRINFKKIKFNYLESKDINKDSNLIRNKIKNSPYEKNNSIKEKIIKINKKYFYKRFNNNLNLTGKINNIKYNQFIRNKSQEDRNKYRLIKQNNIKDNINKNLNLTITNNFFEKNLKNNNINYNVINDKKIRLNQSVNERDKNLSIVKKNIKNHRINNGMSYKIIPQIINLKNSKLKSSPIHSKNSSTLSTEISHITNNKETKKIKNNCSNKLKKMRQKTNINTKTSNIDYNNINIKDVKNKSKKVYINKDTQTYKRKKKSKFNIFINKDIYSNTNNRIFENNHSKNNLFIQVNNISKKINKKEYPNLVHIPNKETKYIKKIESLCKKGYSGPSLKKTNQDNFFIYNNFNNNSNYVYLGVCDGHGLFGQDISTYLVNNLPQNMNKKIVSKNVKNLSNADISLLSSIFQETFADTNMSLNSDERIDSSYSGSTCVSVLFTPNRICCINVGDSRCILGKYLEKGKKWIPYNMSRDHKPSEPDEMLRIKNSGGIIESFRDNFGNFVGPERVWGPDLEGPGLAMSRSFGDEIGHEIGIVADPEILEHFFEKEDKFIVLGSDGIWEFISNEEVVEIVKEYYLDNNIEGAIEHLYNEASNRWIMEEGIIDDITIIIIFLN